MADALWARAMEFYTVGKSSLQLPVATVRVFFFTCFQVPTFRL